VIQICFMTALAERHDPAEPAGGVSSSSCVHYDHG
jgi:hypothetical protein